MNGAEDGRDKATAVSIPLCHVPLVDLTVANPVTVSDQTPLRDVIQAMQTERVGAVLVLDAGHVVGIFSEWHLVQRIIGEAVSLDEPVGRFVELNPLSLKTTDDVGQAIEIMAEGKLRYLPICDEQGEIRGLLSVRRIIECLAQQFPAEVINLPPRADQHMSAPEGG